MHADVDPHAATLEQLVEVTRSLNIPVPETACHDDRDEWLNLLMAERIQPRLGREHPVILCEYPASQAAMANVRPGPPPVAERFELFAGGIELANGYHELLDADELIRRNQLVNQQRREGGKYDLPEESRLLQAMRHGLPQCAGTALGFDRLVMVALGASSLHEVIAFPIDRA
jgi:lysyl-tRNA synthetase class 2